MAEDKAARPLGRGRLRASHADREQVVDLLKAAFVQDRLSKDEFDTRVGQALAARTYADLAALTADLPADVPVSLPAQPDLAAAAVPAAQPAPSRSANATVGKGTRVIAVTTAVTAVAWAGVLFTSAGYEAAGLLWAVTFIWLGIVFMVGSVMLEARLKQDPRAQLPSAPTYPAA